MKTAMLFYICLSLSCSTCEAAFDDIDLCNSATGAQADADASITKARFEPIISACTRLIGEPRKGVNPAITFRLRGDAYKAFGKPDDALADYKIALSISSSPAVATGIYQNRANLYMDIKQYDQALADLDSAIALTSDDVWLYNNRSMAWVAKNNYEKALLDINHVLQINPRNVVAINRRGQINTRLGRFEIALSDFNEVVKLAPKASAAYSSLAYYWEQRGDLDQALIAANKAVQLAGKDDGLAFYSRGELFRYRGNLDAALLDFDESLKREPNDNILSHVGKGLTFEKRNELSDARREFEKALKIDIHNVAVEVPSAPARETARARLAAYDSGEAQPIIPPAPTKAASLNSIPTPEIKNTKALSADDSNILSPNQGRRVALVIGNSAYQNVPPLPNPQKDANAIAASLRNIGFQVVTLEDNDTREKLVNALRSFANEAEKSDWALVYYAGHGMEVGGVNYLIPVDAKIAVDRDIQFEAIPLDQVLAAVDSAKSLKLVMLDACRDNPFKPRLTASPDQVALTSSTAGAPIASRSIGRGLAEVKVQGATLVVYAAKDGQVALDGEGGNSPFAVAVVQRLATPNVEINKLFRLVRDDVMEATAGRQEPYTYGSLPGKKDFYFVAK